MGDNSVFSGTQGPQGPQGTQGSQGPVGTAKILIKDEDGYITATPHTVINFTGAGVAATDAGSGQVDVTIGSSGGLKQTVFAEVSTDVTTTTTAWGTTLISLTITPASASNKLKIHFTCAGWCSTSPDVRAQFRVSVGPTGSEVVKRATHLFCDSTNEAGSASIVLRVDASSTAEHTVIVEWKLNVTATLVIEPVSNPDDHHASLYVEEVSV